MWFWKAFGLVQFTLISLSIYFFTTHHELAHSSAWSNSRVGYSLSNQGDSYLSNKMKGLKTQCTSHISECAWRTGECRIFSMRFPDSLSYLFCFVCLHACINQKWDLHVFIGRDDKPGLQGVKPIIVSGCRPVKRWTGWYSPFSIWQHNS